MSLGRLAETGSGLADPEPDRPFYKRHRQARLALARLRHFLPSYCNLLLRSKLSRHMVGIQSLSSTYGAIVCALVNCTQGVMIQEA